MSSSRVRKSTPISTAPVKLRSACDACSGNKVKCDKKQPVCNRCRTNHFTCSYSPSRRHGKHSWAKRSDGQQFTTSTNSTRLDTTSLPPSLHPLPAIYGAYGSIASDLTPMSLPHASTHPIGPAQIGVESDTRPGSDYFSLDVFDSFADDLDFLSRWTGAELPNNSEASEKPLHEPALDGFDERISISESTQPPVHDCEGRAFTTLHSLHYCTMNHTDRPGAPKQSNTPLGSVPSHMPPLDKVLYFNRAAMGVLKELLDCSCARQPYLTLLYMTILLKALFWYRLAVSPQYHTPSTNAVPDSPTHGISNPTSISPVSVQFRRPKRAVESTSIQIGVFDLEEKDQRELMRGILLREVRKLEAIIDRMRALGGGSEEDDEQHMSNWYALAGAKIEAELQDTIKQIKATRLEEAG